MNLTLILRNKCRNRFRETKKPNQHPTQALEVQAKVLLASAIFFVYMASLMFSHQVIFNKPLPGMKPNRRGTAEGDDDLT